MNGPKSFIQSQKLDTLFSSLLVASTNRNRAPKPPNPANAFRPGRRTPFEAGTSASQIDGQSVHANGRNPVGPLVELLGMPVALKGSVPLWNVIDSPPLAVPHEVASCIRSIIDRTDANGSAAIGRIGVVDGASYLYDQWVIGETAPVAQRPPEAVIDADGLSRPDIHRRDRFHRMPDGIHEALIFGDGVLVAHVRLAAHIRRPRELQRAVQDLRPVLSDRPVTVRSPGVLVVDRKGGVAGHDAIGRAWRSREPQADGLLARLVSTRSDPPRMLLHRGTLVQCRPLEGSSRLHLVSIAPVERVRLAPDADLTPAQRRVAAYAAVGATVDEIARAVRTGRETVRTHLKEVYRRLHVTSRLELARALQT